MRIKNKQSLARLASISALSAGGLGLASPSFTPGVINPLNGKVGFSSGYGSNYKMSFAGTKLSAFRTTSSFSGRTWWTVYVRGVGSGFHIKRSVASLGKVWNSLTNHSGRGATLGVRTCTVSGACQLSAPSGNAYRLFRFQSGGKTLYGWFEYAVTGTGGTRANASGPDVQLLAMAWDPSGNKIPAGKVPAQNVPVAPAPVLAGIAALILGAEGYRSWRAARKKAA
jgi:hypothetical protein